MEQSIQYLYEYENGKRVRNIGFMKVEKQMDKSVIRIFAKQIDEIKGIQFVKPDGKRYVATWEQEEECPKEPEVVAQVNGKDVSEKASEKVSEKVCEEVSEERSNEVCEEQSTEEVEAYIPPIRRTVEKIQRQDLSRLPRKEWKLANNSFLLHGFYNYHHLLYIEEDGHVWIGVPGIYHEKEKMAANAFGFREFRPIADVEVDLSEEEQNTYDNFGYWCRQVEMPLV